MLFHDNHNIWSEHEWESHINEMARRHEHLRHLIQSDSDKKPRWLNHLQDFPTKLDAVDAFIEEELLIEESHFPLYENDDHYEDESLFIEPDEDENDEEWEEEEEGELFEDNPDEDVFFEDPDEDEDESGYDYDSLENIAIYTDVRDFAADLLIFNDSNPEYMNHAGFIRFVSETLLISSKLAAAYSMGFDVEVLGANIAYCKKALKKSNETMELLQKLKGHPIKESDYFELHRRLFELRNNIAIHIQDTRDFFNSML
ncbi:MAG: hypothetical protein WD272_10805 [Balneolales bacterium]